MSRRVQYAEHPDGFCEIHGEGGRRILVLHGGFWRDRYDLTLMDGLCEDLAARGFEAWNAEYRRLGASGARWPEMAADVRAAAELAGAGFADVARADAGPSGALGAVLVLEAVAHGAGLVDYGASALVLPGVTDQPFEGPIALAVVRRNTAIDAAFVVRTQDGEIVAAQEVIVPPEAGATANIPRLPRLGRRAG